MSYLLTKNVEAFGRPTVDQPFGFNLSRMADEFGISRAHIRGVLMGLASRNFIAYEMQLSR